jgi:PAS domain S-box-containing protein
MGRRATLIAIGLVLLGAALVSSASGAEAPSGASVLVLYAQPQIVPAVIDADQGIRATLNASVSPSVRIYTEYLDTSSFASRELQRALVDFLHTKYAPLALDLVMTGGGEALRFAVAHRARLFPDVPIVFFAVNRRVHDAVAFAPNVTGVWLATDAGATLDAALRLQPGLRRVAVAGGAAGPDRLNRAEIRRGLERHAERVEIADLPGASLDDMVREAATLPADTVLFIGSVVRDGAGRITMPADAAARLAAEASVPAYAVFESHVGRGVVGGRVVAFRAQGIAAAALALDLLRGAPAPEAPLSGEQANRWVFDWRAMDRWRLDERALPPGSDVRYRVASPWRLYRWYIVGGVVLLLLQSGLIGGLLVHRARHRRAARALTERVSFEALLAELSAAFNALPASEIDPTVEDALRRLVRTLGVDRVALAGRTRGGAGASITHVSTAPGIPGLPARLDAAEVPWTAARLDRGEIVHFSRLADLPAEAATDRRCYARLGTRSLVAVPLVAGGQVVGVMALSTTAAERAWPRELLDRLHLMAEIFAGALLRRRAEALLHESEERFRLMADHAPVMVWLSGADGRCTYVNRRWLDFTGRAPEQELGRGWLDGVHADDLAERGRTARHAFDARREFVIEYRLRRHDGAYRRVLDQGVPRFAADGTFAGYVGSCVDVTELRAAERTLLESKLLGAAIFTSLAGQVAAVDREGVIIAVNDAWFRHAAEHGADLARSGVGASYLAECHRALVAGEPQAAPALSAIEAVLGGERPHAVVEYQCQCHEPEVRWFQMLVEPLRRPEGGAVICHLDITDRRRAEDEARRRREELAHAQRLSTSGELAASLAHEINQPLLAILSNAQAGDRLLDGAEPDLTEAREALRDIAADAQRAADVIRALRSLVGRRAAVPDEPLDVNDLVTRVVRLVRHDLERRSIALRMDLGADPPPVVGDAVQLQQVILNLLLNASEAIEAQAGGRREIRVSTSRTAPGEAAIEVADTGPGVAEDQLERIFSAFVSSKPDGLGLGLSISRSIVQAGGGRVWATRNPGAGLTLHVVLPSPTLVPVA